MRLYHATSIDNADSIEAHGLESNESDKATIAEETLQDTGISGIYGFADISDAEEFGHDNGGEYVIFEFYADRVIDDPEYDAGIAFLAICDENLDAKKIKEVLL